MRDNKRVFSIALLPLILGAALALSACGGSGNPGPLPDQASVADSSGQPAAAGTTTTESSALTVRAAATATPCASGCITPLAASTFNDSIGVNTHMQFPKYDQNYNSWAPLLLGSHIKHVRDLLCNWGVKSTYCTGTWKSRILAFYNAGIRLDAITDPWMGWTTSTTGCNGTCLDGYLAAMGLPSNLVESYEGPNECDDTPIDCTRIGTRSGLTTAYVVATWSPLIWNLRSSSVKIYSPGMAASYSYLKYAYIGNYTNACSIHDEVNPYQTPEFSMLQYWPNFAKGCQNFVGNEPFVGTESDGWNTDISAGGGKCTNGSTDQLAQERYFPRDLLLHIQKGVRVYPFELDR